MTVPLIVGWLLPTHSSRSIFCGVTGGSLEPSRPSKSAADAGSSAISDVEQYLCNAYPEVVAALLRITLTTSNSANEWPAWALGRLFVCQPNLVLIEFMTMPLQMQSQLYDTLEFGFENVAFPKASARVAALREKLHSLSPKVKP